MRALERRLGEEDAVVGDDADREAPEAREAADQRLAVERLELVKSRAVDQRRMTSLTSYGWRRSVGMP